MDESKIKSSSDCEHPHPGYYRVPFKQGSGYHVALLCSDCGINLNGGGQWVPRRMILGNPDELPIAPGKQFATSQDSVFRDAGGRS